MITICTLHLVSIVKNCYLTDKKQNDVSVARHKVSDNILRIQFHFFSVTVLLFVFNINMVILRI